MQVGVVADISQDVGRFLYRVTMCGLPGTRGQISSGGRRGGVRPEVEPSTGTPLAPRIRRLMSPKSIVLPITVASSMPGAPLQRSATAMLPPGAVHPLQRRIINVLILIERFVLRVTVATPLAVTAIRPFEI